MPLFEYQCDDCGAIFEALVRSQEGDVRCPQCDSLRVRKRLSLFAAPSSTRSVGCSTGGG